MSEPTNKELLDRIIMLEKQVNGMKALARGPKGDDGRDGKDGKDGRDGKTIRDSGSSAASPVINVKYERPAPCPWEFVTDDKGVTIARPIGNLQ